MCRPVNGSREEACPGGHIGPPLRGEGAFRSNGNRCETEPFPNGAGRSPPPTGGSEQAGALWLPLAKSRNEIWGVGHRHRPLRGEGKAPSATLASGAEHLRQRSQGVVGTCGRDHPKVSSNLGQSLNRGIAATAPFAQGSLGAENFRRRSRFAARRIAGAADRRRQ